MFRKLVVVLSVVFGPLSCANAYGQEILSKSDAATLFEMKFTEWKSNVINLSKSGAAKYDSLNHLEYTLIIDVPFGRVVTTPSFKTEDSKPLKLSVAIIFNYREAEVLNGLSTNEHKEMIAEVWQQMQPDFTVMTTINIAPNRVTHNYQIFESGTFTTLDIAGQRGKGCWQECVRRIAQ